MIWRLSVASLVLAILGVNGLADTVWTNAMERYKIIVDSNPFKRFSDPNPLSPSQQQIGNLSLQGFFADGNGKVRKVWLRDNAQNKMFCLGEGESINEYKVEKIDVEKQSVVLTRGPDTVSLKFPEKNPAAPPPMAAAPPGSGRPAYRSPRLAVPPNLQAPVAQPPPGGTAPMPMPMPMPMHNAVTVPPTTTNEQPAAPTSLRRRILRQNVKPVPPPANAPAEKEEVQQTEQATEAAPAAQ